MPTATTGRENRDQGCQVMEHGLFPWRKSYNSLKKFMKKASCRRNEESEDIPDIWGDPLC